MGGFKQSQEISLRLRYPFCEDMAKIQGGAGQVENPRSPGQQPCLG